MKALFTVLLVVGESLGSRVPKFSPVTKDPLQKLTQELVGDRGSEFSSLSSDTNCAALGK